MKIDKIINLCRVLLIVSIVLMTTLVMTSCESNSGKLAKEIPVKVVVLDSSKSNGSSIHTKYKINVISEGVNAYTYNTNIYAQGDTILVKPSMIRY